MQFRGTYMQLRGTAVDGQQETGDADGVETWDADGEQEMGLVTRTA